MEWKFIFIIYASLISTGCLKKHKKIKYYKENTDIYNNVYVTFPDDTCDNRKIEMPDFNARNRRISEVKCLEYIWQIRYEQGKDVRRTQCEKDESDQTPILGGSDVSYGEYPHMGALGWKAKVGTWIFKCGSSLISERFALTAAHCSSVPDTDETVIDVEPKIVRLGCKNIMDKDKGDPANDVNIRRFISYHRYQPLYQYYDIALVELDREVPFRWHVHPACLWNQYRNPEQGTVTGWGVIESASLTASPELQKADIMIIDTDECNEKLKRKHNRRWWGTADHQTCAGDMTGHVDTCWGDSGGPLQTLIPLRHSSPFLRWKIHHILGVTAFGFDCAVHNTPSIYTRVFSYVPWIESIVWRSNRTIANRMLFNT